MIKNNFMFFRKFLLLVLIIFLFNRAEALEIKNIHIGSKVSEPYWIEVLNNTGVIEDLSSYGIFSYKPGLSKPETNHRISKRNEGDNLSIEDGETFYISNSKTEPNFSQKVFYSAFSVAANGGTISITDKNDNILTCIGYKNVDCSNINNENTNSSSTSSTSTSQSTNTKETIKYIYIPLNNQNIYGDIKVLLPEDRVVPALAETDYTVKVIDSDKKVINGLDFHWSFGDGGEKFAKDVSYTFVYPGEYTLIATADGYTSGGQGRMNIKVVKPDLSFSKIGIGGAENYIDLENRTDYDLFLSNFYLKIDGSLYKLPKNLLIPKKKTIHLSGEAVGFKLPAKEISLLYPNKNTLLYYIKEETTLVENATNTNITSASMTKIIDSSIDNNINNITDNNIPHKKSVDENINSKVLVKNKELNVKEYKIDNADNQNINLKIIKRLVLGNNKSISKQKIKEENKEKRNDNNVDIGIISWVRNLLY